MSDTTGEQFTDSIRNYCNDQNIEVFDWRSCNEHYVIIAGNITLDQIGNLHTFYREEYNLKIQFVNHPWAQYSFKITKETT